MIAAPLDAALSQQLVRLERATVRVMEAMTAVGVGLGTIVGLTLSAPLGFACAASSAIFLSWYVVYARLLDAGHASDAMRRVGTVVDALVPWSFFAVIAVRQGAIYALGSWVPPMIFCGVIMSHAVRLRTRGCMAVGGFGTVTYFCVYLAVAYPHVPKVLGPELLFARPSMQITRALSLTLAAGIAALLAQGLKFAIGRAGSEVRSQDLFGKYRLIRRIASGGMGMVFEALYCPEGGFERRVAVKRIHPHLAAEKKFVDAFRDEAELSARLAHPCIVQVFDFGRVADSFFLAMEFVDGMTLSALVYRAKQRNVRLSPELVAFVMRGILSALVYAHEGARGPDGR
ncbi:MAG: protein kinase, partial [Polyangiales bacterium]